MNDTSLAVINEEAKQVSSTIGSFNADVVADKLVVFSELVTEVKLYSYQKEFAYRLAYSLVTNDGEEITALWSRQSGKTESVSNIIVGAMILLPTLANMFEELAHYKKGLWVGVFAPIMEQANTMYERICSRIHSDVAEEILTDPDIQTKVVGHGAKLENGSFVRVMSASKQSNIESKSFHIVIVDECQDVSEMKLLKCLSGDTIMFNGDGSFSTIKEVVDNKLKVITSEGSIDPSEWHSNGKQPVKEILLDNGRTLKVTDNHRHLVHKKGWKKQRMVVTSDLEIGYRLAVPDYVPYFGTDGSYDQGLILGYFLGDGCLVNIPQFIGSEESWDILTGAVLREFDCAKVQYEYKDNGMSEGYFRSNYEWKNPLTEWFRSIGVWGKKGNEKVIPNKAWSRDFLIGLIQGLIETDGCVESSEMKPIISFANISEGMIRQLQMYLLKFGVHSRIFKRKNTFKGLRGVIKDCSDIWILHIKDVDSLMRFVTDIGLLAKKDKLENVKKFCDGKMSRSKGRWYDSSLRFRRIVDIRDAGIDDTYCVTVKGGLFIADCVLTGNSIHPMAAAYNGSIVKIGTPNGQKCEFLEAINRNKRRDLGIKNPCYRNHFEFDYKVCQESNPKYKKFIAREIDRFGEDGDFFRMAYRLHWMIEIGVFITEEKFDQCLNKSFDFVKEDRESVSVFGLDIGKSNDSTVCVILSLDIDNPDENGFYKKRVANILEISGEDYEAQFWQIYEFLGNYRILRGCVDKTAVGDPIADRLYAQFESKDIEIVPITFSTQSKSQMYKYLLQEIQASRMIIPGCKAVLRSRRYSKFRQQMIDLEKSWKGQYMVVHHPEARNAHDDYADALALATWAGSELFMREIEAYSNDVFHARETNPLFSRRADRTIFAGSRRTG